MATGDAAGTAVPATTDPVRVVHVESDADVTTAVAQRLDDHGNAFDYVVERTVPAGLEAVRNGGVDVLVSGHDDVVDGLALLSEVRATDAAVPVVLFPADGSESLAGRAVRAGVTDYVPSSEGVEALCARLLEVVDESAGCPRDTLEERETTLRQSYEIISDRDRPFEEKVNALLCVAQEQIGTDYATLSRVRGQDYVFEVVQAPDDSIEPGDVVPLSATNCERTVITEETLVLNDIAEDAPELTEKAGFEEWGIACYLGAPVMVDGGVYGTFCFYDDEPRSNPFTDWEVTLVDLLARWISYELERERSAERLAAQNERLDQFASIVSHDLRNPLNAAVTNLEMARLEPDDDVFDAIEDAHDRMDQLITDVLALAREGVSVSETAAVDLGTVARAAWDTAETGGATLDIRGDRTIQADESRLQQALENLFRNAVEHGHQDVTVTVDTLDDGFYVADDGPGIPADQRESVFENGFTTGEEGTGLGLYIVDLVADAHDWSVTATESEHGGARFEFHYQ